MKTASLLLQGCVFFHTASNGQSSLHEHAEPYFRLDYWSNGTMAYLLADAKVVFSPEKTQLSAAAESLPVIFTSF